MISTIVVFEHTFKQCAFNEDKMLKLLPDTLLIGYKKNCGLHSASPRVIRKQQTISHDHIKAISSAVIYQSDSAMLTTAQCFLCNTLRI